MPGLSKVIVLDPDGHAGRQVQLGFQREGVPAQLAAIPADPGRLELPAPDAGLVLVGGSNGQALALVRQARAALEAQALDVPIVFAGRGVAREELAAAGADEVVLQPAYLRDVVTIGRLLRGHPASHRTHLVGNLAETTGVLTLVRALSALGRSAVLTLMRGLRRGEVRFFHGEVTSAQVGLIHGQAALHQLLMWTDARFDFRHEDVVRRQQIPMTHDELFADAERFLAGVRESSGSLSPSMILEQDVARIQLLGKQVPPEVQGVLRMFDGHRVLADVLEDSPYRVFETLRVTQRALDVGLLRRASATQPKPTWRAVLAIEEWLVGAETREDVLARTGVETGPVPRTEPGGGGGGGSGSGKTKGGSRRKRKKRRANTPVSAPASASISTQGPEIDWGSLVPRTAGAEVGPVSGVVPAAQLSGEIEATRAEPREKLEALMDTGKRERIFPTDIGLEPSVVLEDRGDADARARAAPEAETTARADEGARAKAEGEAEATARAEADAGAKAEAPAPAPTSAPASGAPSASDLVKQLLDDDRGPAPPRPLARPPTIRDTPAADAGQPAMLSTTAEEARLVASPIVGGEPPAPPASAANVATPFARVDLSEPETAGAPVETIDEPSDGVVRARHSTMPTAPVPPRRPPPGEIPEDDRPHDTTGEIRAPSHADAPSPETSEPSILIADLAAVHSAVSAVASEQAAATATATIATPAREAQVRETRRDATGAFTQIEEEFFRAGHDEHHAEHRAAVRVPSASDSFDDLDEGYQPVGFWDRLLGRKPKR